MHACRALWQIGALEQHTADRDISRRGRKALLRGARSNDHSNRKIARVPFVMTPLGIARLSQKPEPPHD
jgi:hypothetical protein